MPLLRTVDAFDPDRILETMRRLFPTVAATVDSDHESEYRASVFEIDGCRTLASVGPGAIPPPEVQQCAAISPMWPSSDADVLHGAHVILIGQGEDVIASHWACTKIAAAIMDSPDAVGWYIGNASVVHKPDLTVRFATEADREGQLPVLLWVNAIYSQDDESHWSASTFGLEAFGRNELEIVRSTESPNALIGWLFDVGHYMLSTGAEFKTGQTFGGDAEDHRWPVTVGKSLLGKEGTVVRLGIP
jgi:hypothetical protein